MFRFTITQLMMATALVGIVVALVQSDGCQECRARVDCVGFTADGSQIAVSKRQVRAVSFGQSRHLQCMLTLDVLTSAKGTYVGLIHQESFSLDGSNEYVDSIQSPFVFHPTSGCFVAASPMSDKPIRFSVKDRAEKNSSEPLPYEPLVISPSGNHIAYETGIYNFAVVVVDSTDKELREHHTAYGPAQQIPLYGLAFDHDEEKLAIAESNHVILWDLESNQKEKVTIKDSTSPISAFTITPDDTMLICRGPTIERYDLAGKLLATLSHNMNCLQCCVSNDGQSAAFLSEDTLRIFDLATNRISHCIPINAASAMAFSPDDKTFAIGDSKGCVHLYDVQTECCLWSATPPPIEPMPLLWPTCCLALWVVVVGWLWIQR